MRPGQAEVGIAEPEPSGHADGKLRFAKRDQLGRSVGSAILYVDVLKMRASSEPSLLLLDEFTETVVRGSAAARLRNSWSLQNQLVDWSSVAVLSMTFF
jgi:hypothetical protein